MAVVVCLELLDDGAKDRRKEYPWFLMSYSKIAEPMLSKANYFVTICSWAYFYSYYSWEGLASTSLSKTGNFPNLSL